MAYSVWVFGGQTLSVTRVRARHLKAKLRQKIGDTVTSAAIPGRTDKEWRLEIECIITGATKDTLRSAIVALNDGDPHTLSGALADYTSVTDQYIIETDSLAFDDGDRSATEYIYTMVLMQKVQS